MSVLGVNTAGCHSSNGLWALCGKTFVDGDDGKIANLTPPRPYTPTALHRTDTDGATVWRVKRIWLALLIAFARVTILCHTVRPFVAPPPPPKPFGFWWVCPVDPSFGLSHRRPPSHGHGRRPSTVPHTGARGARVITARYNTRVVYAFGRWRAVAAAVVREEHRSTAARGISRRRRRRRRQRRRKRTTTVTPRKTVLIVFLERRT